MATIKDVAKLAKVSIATVSRVINNPSSVSDARTKLVKDAIEELHYVPNIIAKELITKSSATVGLLLPDITNTFTPYIIDSFVKVLSDYHYNVVTCITGFDDKREQELIHVLTARNVCGFVFLGPRQAHSVNNPIISRLTDTFPVIMLDYFDDPKVCHVMADEEEGAYLAAKHLIELGHRNIAFLNGDLSYGTYLHKQAGFLRAFEESGLTPDSSLMKSITPDHIGGYQATTELLQYRNRPTAIFTAGDQIAIGVYRAAQENKVSIPSQLSVIGFSGSPLSLGLHPPLCTISQFAPDIGREAAMLMINLTKHKEEGVKDIIINPALLDRFSCSYAAGHTV